MERDARPLRGCAVPLHFNSHAHVERDITVIGKVKIADNFNSHAHVERDLGVSISQNSISISTHTLTWSVTDEIVGNFTKGRISTHTLTWSVTC